MSFGLFHPDFPFHRLFQDQWAILNQAMVLLQDILRDLSDLRVRCAEIHTLETRQIRVSREILRELSLTLIQPVERQDVYELNRAFEETMRGVKAVSTRAGLYGFTAPRPAALQIGTNLVELLAEVGGVLENLRTITPTTLPVEKMDALREETRMLFLVGLGELYEDRAEGISDLLEIMKWAQIYDRLETTFDRTGEIITAVSGIILKNL